jgi:mRNA interferase MazF
MPLLPGIVPKPGEIYMCDFSGYVPPEIVKMRRVVVVSPANQGARVALVVPISTTQPWTLLPVHVELPGEAVYPCFPGAATVWVKADLIAHVRFDRLDRVRVPILDSVGNPIPRKRVYLPPVRLTPDHLREVRQAILHSLGLGRLASQV